MPSNNPSKSTTPIESEHIGTLIASLTDFAYCLYFHADGSSHHEWLTYRTFEGKTGYDLVQLDDFLSIVHSDDRTLVETYLGEIAEEPLTIECRILTADGKLLWLRLQKQPIFDAEQGKLIRVYYFGNDITESYSRYNYQRELLGHVPHELSQPISTILTRLYMLRRQPDRLEYHLSIVDEVVNNMKLLLHDLQLLSRIERGINTQERMTFSLTLLMEQVLSSLKGRANHKQITLNAKLPPTPIQLHAHHEQLTQALSGIISYILHFSPKESTLDIRCIRQDDRLIIELYHPESPLDAETLAIAFEPFARRSNGSNELTGLELALAHSIICLHDGDVTIQALALDEQNGFGNLFRVTLPLPN